MDCSDECWRRNWACAWTSDTFLAKDEPRLPGYRRTSPYWFARIFTIPRTSPFFRRQQRAPAQIQWFSRSLKRSKMCTIPMLLLRGGASQRVAGRERHTEKSEMTVKGVVTAGREPRRAKGTTRRARTRQRTAEVSQNCEMRYYPIGDPWIW